MLGLVSYDSDDDDNYNDSNEIKTTESVSNNIIIPTILNENEKFENELNVVLISDAQKINNLISSSSNNILSSINLTTMDVTNIQKKYLYLDSLPTSIIAVDVDPEAEKNVKEYLRMKQEENFNLTEVCIYIYIMQKIFHIFNFPLILCRVLEAKNLLEILIFYQLLLIIFKLMR